MTESKEMEKHEPRPMYTVGAVLVLIAIAASVIALSDDQSRAFWGNLTIGASSALSIGAGALLLSKGRLAGPERRANALLVAALLLWLAAWILWAYYEVVLGTAFSPSPADALWLAGYGLSIYYVAWSYRLASSNLLEPRLISIFLATIITSVIVAVFLFPIVNYTLNAGGDWPALLTNISYPVLDGVLLAMAILTLVSLRPRLQMRRFLPSVMIMAALLAAVIADTGFGYGAATDARLLDEQGRLWDVLYSVAYLCIAGALYWQYRLHAAPKKSG